GSVGHGPTITRADTDDSPDRDAPRTRPAGSRTRHVTCESRVTRITIHWDAAVGGSMTITSSGTPMITMSSVHKYFDELHVLNDISVEIPRGQVVMVLGPSGSGKSTLCRTINRLEPIDSGHITIDGKQLPEEGRALAALRADVGMVFQQFNLFAHKSVMDNLTLGPVKVRGIGAPQARTRGMELLHRVGIADQADKY